MSEVNQCNHIYVIMPFQPQSAVEKAGLIFFRLFHKEDEEGIIYHKYSPIYCPNCGVKLEPD